MFELIRQNQRRTIILVIAMGGLLLLLGWLLGEVFWRGAGTAGLLVAGIVWVGLSGVSYFKGDSIVLSISRARKIEKDDHPTLFNVVEEMSIASGLGRVPDIYIIDDPSPNAFAAGRDPQHAVVAVTSGLLEVLTRDELQGVIAHEIGHIRNRDVLYMTMIAVMLGSIILIADVGRRHLFWGGATRSRRSSRDGAAGHAILLIVAIVLIILSPIVAHLIYLAVSRRREYLADATGATYSRYPEALASALEKIAGSGQKMKVANPATAGMFFVNPLRSGGLGLSHLGSTHPPTEERVRILRSMGSVPGFASYDQAFRRISGRPVGLVPHSALESEAAETAAPPPLPLLQPDGAAIPGAAALAHVGRVRETTDALWKTDGYRFIECPCETKLKIPPELAAEEIRCPHCGRLHRPAAA
ncbi:MAG: M48 family metallopeptidase [Thermoanaerobaculia bacterium]|nr:M48 family metallopeptidase [Thermoanaerobaculia bacterium]